MAVSVIKDELLSLHTTLHVGGKAEYFVEVNSELELREAISFAKQQDIEVHILGGGSNLLVADHGVKGLTIKLALKGIEAKPTEGAVIVASAGEELDDVVAYCVERGLWGMENLSHIPGLVGATPVQNVGAYGVEIKDLVTQVRVFNCESEKFEELTPSECAFGYRDSIFKHKEGKKYIVTSVSFLLASEPLPKLSYKDLAQRFEGVAPSLGDIRNAVIDIRSHKFPNWHEVGTAGSFFKNPVVTREKYKQLLLQYPELPGFVTETNKVKLSLGWILDTVLHKKGYVEGNVGTYEAQALVLVAHTGATAEEIKIFAQKIIEEVHSKLGIEIEWEVSLM